MAAKKKDKNKKQKPKAKKTSKVAQRTKMTDEQSEKFLIKHLKDRELKGKDAEAYVRRHAATRLAALDRYNKKAA